MEVKSAIKIFYCYAHADQMLRDELEKHLSPLKRLKYITGFFDRQILAGANFEQEIEKNLDSADIILILVSPDFIASNYSYDIEMARALKRHETGKAHVVPIILRPVYWEDTPLGILQALPTDRKPITQWSDRDEALLNVATGIRDLVRELLPKVTLSSQETVALEQVGQAIVPKKEVQTDQAKSEKYIPPTSNTTSLNQSHAQALQDRRWKKMQNELRHKQPSLKSLYQREQSTPLDNQSNTEENESSSPPIVGRRYLVQSFLRKEQNYSIYQGLDQILQRRVMLKAVPYPYSEYRNAIRAISQFSHPNIVSLYDLRIETDILYIVNEFADGDDFARLLQMRLPPDQVADFGAQICRALVYAGNPSRRVCHGNLTPYAVIRDQQGMVRIDNFALPGDMQYFAAWSTVGSDGFVLSDPELPYGQISDGRRGDDTRAVGLLLYQLLTGKAVDATKVEPPANGRLRFQREVPPELCEVIARSIVRVHPQRILTANSLYSELTAIISSY
ncbi:MAG TPA: TIR domain-containing protein [Ktedonobacteraceae bacterium]|nr:TIR domain-containing protein [Ktedonobacteraceae bacterium]